MLRKRNAYYQEMGEAYEVIRQEEDYTEPSPKVRPPKRRKVYFGSSNAVCRFAADESADRPDAGKKNRKIRRETQIQPKKKPESWKRYCRVGKVCVRRRRNRSR